MLIAVFGTPSPLTLWGLHVIRTMADVVGDSYRFIEAVVIDDLRKAWGEGDNKNIIFYADSPDAAISKIFLSLTSPVPIVLFADDWGDVVGFSMASRQLDFFGAIRFASLNRAALHAFQSSTRVRFIRRGETNDLPDMLHLIARSCEFQLTAEQINEVARRLSSAQVEENSFSVEGQIAIHIPNSTTPGTWIKSLSNTDKRIVDAVLSKQEHGSSTQRITSLTWPREMFVTGPNGSPLTMPIQLTGGRRILIYGPYLHLPPGKWKATVNLEVGENVSGNSVLVDVLCQRTLAAQRFDLPKSGSYEFDINFDIADPRLLVELRFFLEYGAIEGWIDLIKVTIGE
jgi:hypothetical protein